MALLKKNIWMLFTVLLLSGVVLLIVLSVSRWQGMHRHFAENQSALAQNWYGSFSSLLDQQESIITLLGRKLLLDQRKGNEDVREELDAIMALNPEIFAGFALIAPDGQVLELTSNLITDKLPNLLELPQTRDSFSYTMTTDKMVLGRTYFAPRLVIPARKAIYSDSGELLGVMTGALKLYTDDGFFGRSRVLGDFQRITLLRERDQYRQYAGNGELIADFHEQPMDDAEYQQLLKILTDNAYGLEQAQTARAGTHFRRLTADGRGYVRGFALYHPRFEFWLISEIEESFLVQQFVYVFAGYLLIFFIFQGAMYFLARIIDRNQKEQRKLLEYQANHDPLTHLPNRNYMLSAFHFWQQDKEQFSLLFVDLDNFKGINDSFGHSMGDVLLVNLAGRFSRLISDDDLLVRHGGDEFVLLVSGENLPQAEQRAVEHLYEACTDINVNNMIFSPGASIGIARFSDHGSDLEELLRAADIAMYEAKRSRNKVCLLKPELEGSYLFKARIEQLLRGAESRGEIYLQYQPQVDGSGRLHGVEALVRWQHPELGFVPPNTFIEVAEHFGLMPSLGAFIINRALNDIAAIQQQCGVNFSLSINISVRQLEEPDFIEQLLEQIAGSGIASINIALEITENLLIEDLERVCLILNELHDQGIKISLDDFGTGYSSLSVLRHLPLDEIKIDKSFVDHVIDDETALRMIRNIIAIGRNYNVTLLAEGVETEDQLRCLEEVGCDLYQGYYFSRPLSADALRCYLNEHGQ